MKRLTRTYICTELPMNWCCVATGQETIRSQGRGLEQPFPQHREREQALLTPWSWISSLQNCERIHFCCLSHSVCDPLLRQPQDCASGIEPTCQCRKHKRHRFDPWVGKIPWRRAWQLTPVFLPGESHGLRNLVGYSPWGCKESDTTEVCLKHTGC